MTATSCCESATRRGPERNAADASIRPLTPWEGRVEPRDVAREVVVPGELFSHVAFVGVVVQGAVALLLAILFLALRRLASHRPYLRDWSVAFVGLALAIASVFVRSLATDVEWTRLLYVLYQATKLVFFVCVLSGALRFAGRRLALPRPALAAILLAYAAITVYARRDLNGVVLWQTPVAIAASLVAGAWMLRLPAERRSLGTRMTGWACLAFALLWSVYAVAFAL